MESKRSSSISSGEKEGLCGFVAPRVDQTRDSVLKPHRDYRLFQSSSPTGTTASKFYAVRIGRRIGVFESWAECRAMVDGFSSAEFQSFPTRWKAEDFMRAEPRMRRVNYMNLSSSSSFVGGRALRAIVRVLQAEETGSQNISVASIRAQMST